MTNRRVRAQDLAWIVKRKAEQLQQMTAGASLVTRTGYSIEEVTVKATLARLDLARHFLNSAKVAGGQSADYRSAISRSYYSMYHAMRATVFFATKGDDYEKHSVLQEHLPVDFPDAAMWRNELKSARLSRNRADYDIVPRNVATLELDAASLLTTANRLLPVVRAYLRSRGCQ